MIKEALEYIVKLKAPVVQDIHGHTYSDKKLERVKFNPKAEVIKMTTLSSLIDYITLGVDTFKGDMIVHVVSPSLVRFYSALDEDRERELLVEVNASIPEFKFDTFIEHEKFIIGVQSKFLDDGMNKDLVLKFAGTVEDGTIASYGDDGVTQKAVVKTGITSKGEAIVPSPVSLKPYRTFVEVDQPCSDFIFRLKKDKYDDGITCALIEADGGAWKNEAMRNIKDYLTGALEAVSDVYVIS